MTGVRWITEDPLCPVEPLRVCNVLQGWQGRSIIFCADILTPCRAFLSISKKCRLCWALLTTAVVLVCHVRSWDTWTPRNLKEGTLYTHCLSAAGRGPHVDGMLLHLVLVGLWQPAHLDNQLWLTWILSFKSLSWVCMSILLQLNSTRCMCLSCLA